MPPPLPLPCSPLTPSPAVLPKRMYTKISMNLDAGTLRRNKGAMRVNSAALKSTGGKAPSLASPPTEESLKDNAFNITKHVSSPDKSEDKQTSMKDIVQDLFRRETSWWRSLTDKDKSKLCPGWKPCIGYDAPLGAYMYVWQSGTRIGWNQTLLYCKSLHS